MPVNFKRLRMREKAISSYNEYLQSSIWDEKREDVLLRDDYTCQSCGDTQGLHVHHITYKRLGNERMEDLITLCDRCHEFEHQ